MGGGAAARAIRQMGSRTSIIAMCTFQEERLVREVLRAKATVPVVSLALPVRQ
jgi:hypothetical protein